MRAIRWPQLLPRETTHLIHIGAGKCHEFELYELLPDLIQVDLCEPDSQLLRFLQRRLSGNRIARFHELALSYRPASAACFYTSSLPGFSSLRAPTALLEIFPGMDFSTDATVEVESAGRFVKQNTHNEGCLTVIVDAPGEEAEIVRSLIDEEVMPKISALVLNCGKEPLYERGQSADAVISLIESVEMRLFGDHFSEDIDYVTALFYRDDVELSREEAKQRNADEDVQRLIDELEAEKAKVKWRTSDLEDLQAKYVEVIELARLQDEVITKAEKRLGRLSALFEDLKGAPQEDQILDVVTQLIDTLERMRDARGA